MTLALALGVLSVLLVPHGARAKARLHAAGPVQGNVEVETKTEVPEVKSEAAGGGLREVNLEDVPITLITPYCPNTAII